MDKTATNLSGRFYTAVIAVFAFTQFVYLFLINNIFSVREISDLDSLRYIELANIPLVLISVIAVLCLGVFIFKKFASRSIPERAEKVIVFLIFFSCLIWAVGSSSIIPMYDRLQVQQAVYGLNWDEYEKFATGGYFWVCPNNGSITLVYYLISLATGSYNYLLLMLINACMLPVIYDDLAQIAGMLGAGRKVKCLILISGILFAPSCALTAYIYGTVPGLFLAVKALKLVMQFRAEGHLRKGITGCILAALAVFLKYNYVIFLIAICIYLVFCFIKDKNKNLLISAGAGIAVIAVLMLSLPFMVKMVTGYKLNEGAPSVSFVAMGMQEPYGMYNGYNNVTYESLGYDSSKEAEIAGEFIKGRLGEFVSDPAYAASFYTKKVGAQWADPTFDYIMSISERLYSSDTAPSFFWKITRPSFVKVISDITKIFLIFIFLGAASFAATFRRKENSYEAGLMLMTFVGGFLFHLIWESGSSYALPYFMTIIPIGIMGLKDLIAGIASTDIKALTKLNIDPKGFIWYFAGACLMFLLAALGVGTLKSQIAYDKTQIDAYYASDMQRAMPSDIEGARKLVSSSGDKTIDVTILRYCGRYRIRLLTGDVDVYFTLGDLGSGADYFSYGKDQTYNIFENPDGTYLILTDKTHAMAYDDSNGRIVLSEIPNAYESFYSENFAGFVTENPSICWKIQ